MLCYAQRLRQLQGVIWTALNQDEAISAAQNRQTVQDAIINLGLEDDKLMQALFKNIAELQPIQTLKHDFAQLKRDSALSSFIEQDTIQSYYSGRM